MSTHDSFLAKEERDGKKLEFDADDDLPGLGQYYCTPCARHFDNQATLDGHTTTKQHKRRLRETKQEKYTQDIADMGAGKTKEILPPAHPK